MVHKKIAVVVASQGYQPDEFEETQLALENAHVQVIMVSDRPHEAAATDGSSVVVDLLLSDLKVDDIDGIVFIGGAGALPCLDNDISYEKLRQVAKEKKIIGAICIAPRILARAGVLKSRQATGWDKDGELDEIFKLHEVTYTKSNVVTDGLFVTANGPHAAADFGQALVRVLRAQE